MLHILKADSVPDNVLPIDGDYDTLYTRLVREGGYKGEILTWDVRNQRVYPQPKDGDTLLISGSRSDAFDNNDWTIQLLDFVRNALEAKMGSVKVIGVCYGHQLIARALGAPIGRSTQGWEVSTTPVRLTDAGKKVFTELACLEPVLLNQMHSDQVFELPEGAQLLASTEGGPIQAYWSPGRYLCVQGHPEFSNDVTSLFCDLVLKEQDLLDAKKRAAASDHHGPLFGHAFARFIES